MRGSSKSVKNKKSLRYKQAIDCDTKQLDGDKGFSMWPWDPTCFQEWRDPCRKCAAYWSKKLKKTNSQAVKEKHLSPVEGGHFFNYIVAKWTIERCSQAGANHILLARRSGRFYLPCGENQHFPRQCDTVSLFCLLVATSSMDAMEKGKTNCRG